VTVTLDPRAISRLTAEYRLESIGRSGLVVSICVGPSKTGVFCWSVDVLSRDGQSFEQPFQAQDFAHAVDIAELEIAKRGWG